MDGMERSSSVGSEGGRSEFEMTKTGSHLSRTVSQSEPDLNVSKHQDRESIPDTKSLRSRKAKKLERKLRKAGISMDSLSSASDWLGKKNARANDKISGKANDLSRTELNRLRHDVKKEIEVNSDKIIENKIEDFARKYELSDSLMSISSQLRSDNIDDLKMQLAGEIEDMKLDREALLLERNSKKRAASLKKFFTLGFRGDKESMEANKANASYKELKESIGSGQKALAELKQLKDEIAYIERKVGEAKDQVTEIHSSKRRRKY